MSGLWKHKTKTIQFVLVVKDFGIKYINKDDLDHLIRTLEKYYDVAVDLDGKEFVKIELDWYYEKTSSLINGALPPESFETI